MGYSDETISSTVGHSNIRRKQALNAAKSVSAVREFAHGCGDSGQNVLMPKIATLQMAISGSVWLCINSLL